MISCFEDAFQSLFWRLPILIFSSYFHRFFFCLSLHLIVRHLVTVTPLCFPSLTGVFSGETVFKKTAKIVKNTHRISKAPVQEWGSVGLAKETMGSVFRKARPSFPLCHRNMYLELFLRTVDTVHVVLFGVLPDLFHEGVRLRSHPVVTGAFLSVYTHELREVFVDCFPVHRVP